ncbi:uncharacterized protein LOC108627401 isoform X2 [Ceratina calcarata]|uniref:Uncharacterized protein LOC108627401 isoform X2 n=1 Tax=Ceratina calcarata TaxID=156304 RepID=A0AAJ7J3V9_9HYME|nr:uncharacterized protein LOC108627401 isoform X2 [Ceratina calcarata]
MLPQDANDYQLLSYAVEKGFLKVVEALLKLGADVNQLYESGKFNKRLTLLHIAAWTKQKEMARLLINYKADVNAKDGTDYVPMHYVVRNDDLKMSRLLLSNNAEIKDEPILLCIAIVNKCKPVIELLLQYGIDINCKDQFGMTALHTCVYYCANYEIPKLMLNEHAEIDSKTNTDVTMLDEGVRESNIGIVDILLKYNADVNCADGNGATPLHYSAKNGTMEICKLLVKKSANVDTKQNDGSTPLHLAAREGHMDIIEVLLNAGADINCTDLNGHTSLHECASLRRIDVAKFLLDHNADINSKSVQGDTPLHLSAINYNDDMCKLLISNGADVSSQGNDGSTPLHRAVKKGVVSIIEILVNFGADVHCRDQCGNTALHLASKRGEYDAVLTLIRHGSDINILNKQNYTPLHFALFLNNKTITIFVEHIIKMMTANLYLNPVIMSAFNTIYNPDTIQFEEKCKEELERMTKAKIINNISLRDILTKNRSQLLQYVRNKDIMQYLKLNNYAVKFPLYASIINNRFISGVERIKLLDEGVRVSHDFFRAFLVNRALPYICIEHIFGYLSNHDLKILIDVCTYVN